MLRTYDAILKDGRLEWNGEAPDQREPLRVQVTVIPATDPESDAERGRRMAAALRKLAEMNAFAEITDPVAWQREIRKDRPLPGRED
jgi:hypothetical protein